jgi:hypothetical protein
MRKASTPKAAHSVFPEPLDEQPASGRVRRRTWEGDPNNDRAAIQGKVGPTVDLDVGFSAGGQKLTAPNPNRHPTAKYGEVGVGPNIKVAGDGRQMPVMGSVVRTMPDPAGVAHAKHSSISAEPGPAIHYSSNAAVADAEKSRAARKARNQASGKRGSRPDEVRPSRKSV